MRVPPPPGYRAVVGGVVAATVLGLLAGSPLLTVAPAFLAAAGTHRRRRAAARRRRLRLAEDLAGYVDELIQRLAVGGSLAAAVRDPTTLPDPASPLAQAMAPFRRALAAGAALDDALATLADPAPSGAELLVGTLRTLADRGGPAVPSLERLSDTVRSAHALDQELRAQAGQATASAGALTALPGLFAAAMAALDPRLASLYLRHPAGAACLVGAGLLSHAGWWWMDRLVTDGGGLA
ncbi:MAG: type II secretion system F family protein [Acidimicrobiales bacterium]